jgi:hypothetical protein
LKAGALQAGGTAGEWALATAGSSSWDYVRISATLDADVAAGIAFGVDEVLGMLQSIAAVVETTGDARTLAIYQLSGGTRTLLAKAKEPVDLGTRVTLIATVFDDLVRVVAQGEKTDAGGKISRVEETLDAPRQAVRNGQVALVSGGAAVFSSLRVEGLELYRFRFSASRYRGFKDHIESIHAGADPAQPVVVPRLDPAEDLGTEPVTIGSDVLTASEVSSIDALETRDERQALFASILTRLGTPLRQELDRLALTRIVDSKGTAVLLLESPEPIVFQSEVQLAIQREDGTAVPVKILGNATSTAALIVPTSPFGSQPLTLTFNLSRRRWATTSGEPAATYTAVASISIT